MRVTFVDEHWGKGKAATEAAIAGASDRLRPILMTACAMTVGMVPMALALERGSQMQAPLGRAVIGGLVMSTFATLPVLPSILALVIGRRAARYPPIYPDHPERPDYDRLVSVKEAGPGHHATSTDNREPAGEHDALEPVRVSHPRHDNEEVLAFLRRILNEARSKRHDMTTHYTVDDLLTALG